MRQAKTEQLQGALPVLVLRTLVTGGPMHGHAIATRIEQISSDVLRVEAGSLYPALHRMEESGWVKSAWRQSENNRRARYYTITPAGRRQLATEEATWSRTADAVFHVLKNA